MNEHTDAEKWRTFCSDTLREAIGDCSEGCPETVQVDAERLGFAIGVGDRMAAELARLCAENAELRADNDAFLVAGIRKVAAEVFPKSFGVDALAADNERLKAALELAISWMPPCSCRDGGCARCRAAAALAGEGPKQ